MTKVGYWRSQHCLIVTFALSSTTANPLATWMSVSALRPPLMPQGLVLSHIEVVLDDTEWLVSKLKGDSEWVHTFVPL